MYGLVGSGACAAISETRPIASSSGDGIGAAPSGGIGGAAPGPPGGIGGAPGAAPGSPAYGRRCPVAGSVGMMSPKSV